MFIKTLLILLITIFSFSTYQLNSKKEQKMKYNWEKNKVEVQKKYS